MPLLPISEDLRGEHEAQAQRKGATQKNPDQPSERAGVMASSVNCIRMIFFVAPIAFLTPISRVRSVTETSMIFITPTPPTIRPTAEPEHQRNSEPVIWFPNARDGVGPKDGEVILGLVRTLRDGGGAIR